MFGPFFHSSDVKNGFGVPKLVGYDSINFNDDHFIEKWHKNHPKWPKIPLLTVKNAGKTANNNNKNKKKVSLISLMTLV